MFRTIFCSSFHVARVSLAKFLFPFQRFFFVVCFLRFEIKSCKAGRWKNWTPEEEKKTFGKTFILLLFWVLLLSCCFRTCLFVGGWEKVNTSFSFPHEDYTAKDLYIFMCWNKSFLDGIIYIDRRHATLSHTQVYPFNSMMMFGSISGDTCVTCNV